MDAAQGDGSLSGGIQGDSLQAIAQYFQQRNCRHCSQPYAAEGIELIRQEPGVVVVRVVCCSCNRPLGIALVGMNTPNKATCQHGRPAATNANQQQTRKRPSEWTNKDAERLSDKPVISYDDVLQAHQFFSGLEAGWSKLLPKVSKIKNLP